MHRSIPLEAGPYPAEPFATELRGTRHLGLWGSLVGIALVLACSIPFIATVVMVQWGDALAGPYDGNKMHGIDVFLGWLVTSVGGVMLIAALAVAALTLDILMLVRLDRLRTIGARNVAPLGWSLLVGSGIVSTPILGMLLFVPVWIFGAGLATTVALWLLLALMALLPIAGRIAQIVTARRVRPPEALVRPSGVAAPPHRA